MSLRLTWRSRGTRQKRRAPQLYVETVEKPQIGTILLKQLAEAKSWIEIEVEIHLKLRQSLHRRHFALSLSSMDTTALLLRCADSGETRSENRVFLQSRYVVHTKRAEEQIGVG